MSTRRVEERGSFRALVCVLAKRPVAGLVKTRLCPPLEPARAAELALAFLDDTLGNFAAYRARAGADAAPARLRLELALDDGGLGPGPGIEALAARHGIGIRGQGDGDLGGRMARLLEEGLSQGLPVLLAGSDSPDLPHRILDEALAALDRVDAVLAPAGDGGYVLAGARRRLPELFEIDAPWSSDRVLAATVASLERGRCSFEVLSSWEDVDDAAALGRLAVRLADPGDSRRPEQDDRSEPSAAAETAARDAETALRPSVVAPATARLLKLWRREGVRF